MMEILNEINDKKRIQIDGFLTFIGIYEDKKREIALKRLLKENVDFIKGKVCVEAGAGFGLFSIYMKKLGAKKVYAVEENKVMYQILKENLKGYRDIYPVNKKIEDFIPDEEIDLLFHEFYGSLLFDESIHALYKLKFKPKVIIPDGGRIWCMLIKEEEIKKKDKIYRPEWKKIFKNTLILDLFPWIKFKNHKLVIDWNYKKGIKDKYVFTIKEKGDFIAFSSEITHRGKSILKMWEAKNWAIIFTPKTGNRFFLKFKYKGAYTEVKFKWL